MLGMFLVQWRERRCTLESPKASNKDVSRSMINKFELEDDTGNVHSS